MQSMRKEESKFYISLKSWEKRGEQKKLIKYPAIDPCRVYMNMLSFGDRNPVDGNAVRRDHGCVYWISCWPGRHLLGVCSAHRGVSAPFAGDGDHPSRWRLAGWGTQHYLGPPHCSWHAYFTGGGIRLCGLLSALLPTCSAGTPTALRQRCHFAGEALLSLWAVRSWFSSLLYSFLSWFDREKCGVG